MNDIDHLLGPALRERLRTETPDLEHLAATSLRAGLRLRRRRRVATVAGGTAVLAVAGVALGQSGGGTTARDPEVATTATATPSEPATTVTADPSAGLPPDLPTGAPTPTAPIVVSVPGWTCGEYADEKMPCTKGDLFVSVVVRDGAEHDAWAADADKGGSSLWVSPVHDGVFVSVQGGPLAQADLTAFVDGIEFTGAPRLP